MNTESTIQTGSTRQGGADQNLRFHNLRPASPPGGVGPLPHSIDAEIALLGCLLLDPVQAFPVVMAENIVADHFYDMRYGKLFCLLRKLYRANGAFDMIVVTNALRDAGELDALGGVPMLSSMMNSVPSAASDVVKMYGDVLKDKKRRRYMIDVAHRLHQLASDVSVP
jgi:replicative DNA helicase